MKQKTHFRHPNAVVFICLLAAIALIFTAVVIPPQGEISPSVLIAAGQFLILVAGIVGLSINIDIKEGEFDVGKNKDDTPHT